MGIGEIAFRLIAEWPGPCLGMQIQNDGQNRGVGAVGWAMSGENRVVIFQCL